MPTLGAGSTPTDLEVMQIEDDPAIGPDPLPDWRIPYLECLVHGALSTNKTKARRLASRAKSFVLLDWELYKQSPTGVLQRCIPSELGKSYYRTSMGASAATMQHHALLLETRFDKGFTSPLPWMTRPR
jgi:hypothetical protein